MLTTSSHLQPLPFAAAEELGSSRQDPQGKLLPGSFLTRSTWGARLGQADHGLDGLVPSPALSPHRPQKKAPSRSLPCSRSTRSICSRRRRGWVPTTLRVRPCTRGGFGSKLGAEALSAVRFPLSAARTACAAWRCLAPQSAPPRSALRTPAAPGGRAACQMGAPGRRSRAGILGGEARTRQGGPTPGNEARCGSGSRRGA